MTKFPTSIGSLGQFLRLPELKPALEFIDGRMIQKMSPLLPHSILQSSLVNNLDTYAVPLKLGRCYPELRVVVGGTALVPDISFFGAGRLPRYERRGKAPRIVVAPDLVVEILSQGQAASELRRKVRFLLRHGTKLGWLISPRSERIQVLREGRPALTLKVGDHMGGEDVLPGYSIPLEEIFGWLDRH